MFETTKQIKGGFSLDKESSIRKLPHFCHLLKKSALNILEQRSVNWGSGTKPTPLILQIKCFWYRAIHLHIVCGCL